MTERVYIVGAGAIGKALAVFLTSNGKEVILIRGSVDNGTEEIVSFEVMSNNNTTVKADVLTSTFSQQKKIDGVVVLTNKSFGNASVAAALKEKIGTSPIVIMQNGLNIEEPFLNDQFEHIYRCVLFATSQSITDRAVRFKPVALSAIGNVKGSGSHLQQIVAYLNTGEFGFQAVPDIHPVIWKKVIANCVFNSICPLLDTDNGIFHRDEAARSLAIEVIAECVHVARAAGVAIDENEVLQAVLLISKSSDGQLISTLQDIRNKRPTEIDSLNFAIVKIASQLNMAEVTLKTKLLGELTKLKSHL
jgi:2-dehydropantoate 2-reductase